ncbi:hypothetical protein PLESTF_000099600 [Pleodorina starrii]|nr:hypothetical protein PLESTM_001265500 [Pleodorina starrii]GLC63928.1 hypothetical protein PLESTF_000099600 [Pleodorina starrii]
MFCRKQAGSVRDRVFSQRLRRNVPPAYLPFCVSTAKASAPADAVATMTRSALAPSPTGSTEADVETLPRSFEPLDASPAASMSGRSPDRPWSFADAPTDTPGRIFGWQSGCPSSTPYAAAGVIPFAYRPEEGQLYVLMSVQMSDKSRKSHVYTFLGGKITKADRCDARRTAAREAYEESHRLLDEQRVLDALMGRTPSYDGAGNSEPTPPPPPPPSSSAAAADPDAANAIQSPSVGGVATPQQQGEGEREEDVAGGSGAGGGAAAAAGDVDAGALPSGPYPVPCEYYASGRYMAFAMHMPNAWGLEEECTAKIRAGQKHPEAKKAVGLEWISMSRMKKLQLGQVLSHPSTGRQARGHHYTLSLLRSGGRETETINVFTWLSRLEGHLREWHGWQGKGETVEEEGLSAREAAAEKAAVKELKRERAAERQAAAAAAKEESKREKAREMQAANDAAVAAHAAFRAARAAAAAEAAREGATGEGATSASAGSPQPLPRPTHVAAVSNSRAVEASYDFKRLYTRWDIDGGAARFPIASKPPPTVLCPQPEWKPPAATPAGAAAREGATGEAPNDIKRRHTRSEIDGGAARLPIGQTVVSVRPGESPWEALAALTAAAAAAAEPASSTVSSSRDADTAAAAAAAAGTESDASAPAAAAGLDRPQQGEEAEKGEEAGKTTEAAVSELHLVRRHLEQLQLQQQQLLQQLQQLQLDESQAAAPAAAAAVAGASAGGISGVGGDAPVAATAAAPVDLPRPPADPSQGRQSSPPSTTSTAAAAAASARSQADGQVESTAAHSESAPTTQQMQAQPATAAAQQQQQQQQAHHPHPHQHPESRPQGGPTEAAEAGTAQEQDAAGPRTRAATGGSAAAAAEAGGDAAGATTNGAG